MVGPTTAVIGAGISGLTVGKMLSDYGVPYTCFESSDRIGGNWAFGNPNGHSSAYRSLHIDTSKERLSFRDFPMPKHYPDFPHHTQIKDYLESYAEAFDLKDNIEFKNGVAHAKRLDGGGWEILDQAGATRQFEHLVVANGHHWDPRFAEFPGEFTGESMHSHHYIDPKTPLDFFGRRILVVGLGNSAADIAVELSSKSLQTEVTLSTRSGAWIVPKYVYGKPADTMYRTTPYLPLSWQRKIMQMAQPMNGSNGALYGLPQPNHKFFEAHPTQSVELPLRLGSGDVVPKPNVVVPRRQHGALRGRHERASSTSSSTRRATTSRSRSSTPTSSARPTTTSRCSSASTSQESTISRSSASPSRRRRCSRSWSRRLGWSLPTSSASTRCRASARWSRRSGPTRRSTSATSSRPHGTRSRSTTSSTSTTSAPGRSLPVGVERRQAHAV